MELEIINLSRDLSPSASIGCRIRIQSTKGIGFGIGAVFVGTELAVGALFWLMNFIFFFREARKMKKKLHGRRWSAA